ncbi:MAG: PhoH family protein [Succinivibrio sp.]|nr:PhoH family protein [Succinivibrio sp.]
MSQTIAEDFMLSPASRHRLRSLVGAEDEHLKLIAKRTATTISYVGEHFHVEGAPHQVELTIRLLKDLYVETAPLHQEKCRELTLDEVHLMLTEKLKLRQDEPQEKHDNPGSIDALYSKSSTFKTSRGFIKARTRNQEEYIAKIMQHDVTFGIGPAGTGKTYLAVAAAVDALERLEIRRIILTRPAVEAGEKLGFLPGDLSEKVDPYLRPLYDALFELLGFEKVQKLIERQVIEIAPLAYMRGRTLNDAFIILDEAQNTTCEQMKMFLTRIGFNSHAVITGDPSQIDLPHHQKSGLRQAMEVLQGLKQLGFTFFTADDVVRHPVVAAIVNAYAQAEQAANEEQKARAAASRTDSEQEREPYASLPKHHESLLTATD